MMSTSTISLGDGLSMNVTTAIVLIPNRFTSSSSRMFLTSFQTFFFSLLVVTINIIDFNYPRVLIATIFEHTESLFFAAILRLRCGFAIAVRKYPAMMSTSTISLGDGLSMNVTTAIVLIPNRFTSSSSRMFLTSFQTFFFSLLVVTINIIDFNYPRVLITSIFVHAESYFFGAIVVAF